MNFSNAKIAVIGDIMLDEYFWSNVNRISPEAPVPIALLKDKTCTLGGAGNVALNCKTLGCEVDFFGIIGPDEGGNIIQSMLHEQKIKDKLILVNKPTTHKIRVMAQNQQLIRIDKEKAEEITKNQEEEIINSIDFMHYNAIVLSDYAKGLLTENLCQSIIKNAKNFDVPVLVDPKSINWNIYSDCFCITPNKQEFFNIAFSSKRSDGIINSEADNIRKRYRINNLLIKLGKDGIILFNDNNEPFGAKPEKEITVRDVCGAGDTVIATLAACIGSSMNINEAVKMAVKAASIVIEKVGVQPVTIEELNNANS